MRSLKFPKMFNTNTANVWADKDYSKQTLQNIKLLLQTERGELFGDPYIGCKLKQFMFDQNNYILRESLIDTIYTQLALFIPQLRIKRNDINIVSGPEKGKVYCTISGISQIDYTQDTYKLVLLDESDM